MAPGDGEMGNDPKLSIILTVVEGGDFVADFLRAVAEMEDAPPLEVIVPYDDSVADIARFAVEFPDAAFLPLGRIAPEHPVESDAGQHELYDRRRAAGLAAATGDIIAILEDRGQPRADWARTVIRLHATLDNNVIGGAIDSREPVGLLNWAVHVLDFGRYARPFESGPAEWVSDVNISYSRAAIEETRQLWSERYQEPVVHWHLIGKGERLWLSNEMVVLHRRPPLSLRRVLAERFGWGRLFGAIRVRDLGPAKRLALIMVSPLIAPVLWLRHYRIQVSKGRGARYLRALPFVMILSTAWAVGEVAGFITRKG